MGTSVVAALFWFATAAQPELFIKNTLRCQRKKRKKRKKVVTDFYLVCFSDEKNHKTTYVTLKGLERSQRDVEDISKKAIDILEKYDKGDCYLTNLTRFLIHRTH